MREVLLGFGAVLFAIAFALWRNGSYWGMVIALYLTLWGLVFVAWGLVVGWFDSAAACAGGALLAAVATAWALVWAPTWGAFTLACAVCAAPAVAIGASRAWRLARHR